MDINNIIKQLNSTNSVKDKEAILQEHEHNAELKDLLYLSLNPYKLYHMNKIPEYNKNKSGIVDLKKLCQICEKLDQRLLVGNEALSEVKSFLEATEENYAELFAKVLSKSSIGVGTKTVNKVWPNFIPEFKLMLAPNELPEITSITLPTYIQPKLDGFRCVYKAGLLWSRSGKPFGNKNLIKYFNCLTKVKNYVLDGELYSHEIGFQKLTSILNSEEMEIPKDLKYFVYDCVPNTDWNNQSCKLIYEKRVTLIRENLNDIIADYKKVIDVSTDLCQNAAEIAQKYKEHLKDGYEGSMVKDPKGLYRWKRVTVRSGEMLKLKPFKTEDLEIVGFYEGEGKFKGTLGGVVVAIDPNITCNIGSGFDNNLREKIWANQGNYLSKIVEIQYFEKTDEGSLRFPTFKRLREDK